MNLFYLRITSFVVLIATTPALQATTWLVGPGKTYTTPSAVSNLVMNGDTVLIDPVEYVGDVAFWKAHNLLLKGTSGYAHLNANGKSAGQKAIWVLQGNDITVENIEFSDCKVPDKNGAGIRQEGTNLTVRHCYFHHNEMGLLAGNNAASTIIVSHSTFGFNGYGDGFSHNIYVNHIGHFIFQYNWSYDSKIGHLVKSRAHINEILYNRLESTTGSGVSYEIDLPNGGVSRIIGNIIYQPVDGANSSLISYGQEGLTNPGPHALYCINNTMVNAKNVGRFLSLNPGTDLCKAWNNLYVGGGMELNGPVLALDTLHNLRFTAIGEVHFEDPANFNYHLTAISPAIDKGGDPGTGGGWSLLPEWEYRHPTSKEERIILGPVDVGALEGTTTTWISSPNLPTLHVWRSGPLLAYGPEVSGTHWEVYSLNGSMIGGGRFGMDVTLPEGMVIVVLWDREVRKGVRVVY